MKNTIVNRGIIKKIALALAELNEEVIYVGGAVVSLYINDPAADDIRPTKDIDISLSVATLGELENVREKLIAKGFFQTSEDNVICRFRYDDVLVDVMNTKSIGWAPANPWFAPGFALREYWRSKDSKYIYYRYPIFWQQSSALISAEEIMIRSQVMILKILFICSTIQLTCLSNWKKRLPM